MVPRALPLVAVWRGSSRRHTRRHIDRHHGTPTDACHRRSSSTSRAETCSACRALLPRSSPIRKNVSTFDGKKLPIRYNVDHQLVRFRGRAVADLKNWFFEVRELFEEMKIKRGQTTAGGAMRVLRALIDTGQGGSTRQSAPIRAARCAYPKRPQPRKTRRVEILDIAKWWIETNKLSPIRRDLHRAMLLRTGRATIIYFKRAASGRRPLIEPS